MSGDASASIPVIVTDAASMGDADESVPAPVPVVRVVSDAAAAARASVPRLAIEGVEEGGAGGAVSPGGMPPGSGGRRRGMTTISPRAGSASPPTGRQRGSTFMSPRTDDESAGDRSPSPPGVADMLGLARGANNSRTASLSESTQVHTPTGARRTSAAAASVGPRESVFGMSARGSTKRGPSASGGASDAGRSANRSGSNTGLGDHSGPSIQGSVRQVGSVVLSDGGRDAARSVRSEQSNVSVRQVEEEDYEAPVVPQRSREEQQIQDLNIEVQNLDMRLGRADKEIDRLRDENQQLQATVKTQTAELAEAVRARDDAREEAADAQERFDDLVAAHEGNSDSDDLDTLRSRVADLESKLKKAEKKAKAAGKGEKTAARVKELELEMEERQVQYEARIQALQAQVSRLNQDNEELMSIRDFGGLQNSFVGDDVAAVMQQSIPHIDEGTVTSFADVTASRLPSRLLSGTQRRAEAAAAGAGGIGSRDSSTGGGVKAVPSFFEFGRGTFAAGPPIPAGTKVLAWWEPNMDLAAPYAWRQDRAGWYPATVLPQQGIPDSHIAVNFAKNAAADTPVVAVLLRPNVRKADAVESASDAERLAEQMLAKNPWVKSRMEDPTKAMAAAYHLALSEGLAQPAAGSPARMLAVDAAGGVGGGVPSAAAAAAAGIASPPGAQRAATLAANRMLSPVASQNDARSLASQLVSSARTRLKGTGGRTTYTVIGQLSADEAKTAASRILAWDKSPPPSQPQRARN